MKTEVSKENAGQCGTDEGKDNLLTQVVAGVLLLHDFTDDVTAVSRP
jgi:hypothetical protein